MKRLAILVSILSLLSVWVTGAEAAGGGATVTTFPVSFELSRATCQYLPAGTTVAGSGIEKTITRSRTDTNGVTTIVGEAHAYGTATDHAGNTYVFNYSSPYRLSNTAANPTRYSGSLSDVFTLSGNGPVSLHNGFVADVTVDAPDIMQMESWLVTWDNVKHSYGDSISFQNGPFVERCDPL